MGRLKYAVYFLTLVIIQISKAQDTKYYKGAVVGYANVWDRQKSTLSNIDSNVQQYENFIKDAKKQGADIIVFPECGLTSITLSSDYNSLLDYTTVVPSADENIIPCNSSVNNEVQPWAMSIQRMSCAAQKYKIYVVINLPERYKDKNAKDGDNDYIYNTNVVFDRQGKIIARYRKYNLFGEAGFNVTKTPELVTFDTDFGVKFGTFICFDILFAKPALQLVHDLGVHDFVYPTAWFSELPFLSAVQTQAGWARANGVNLLAAAYNDPVKYAGGSGIYTVEGIKNITIPQFKDSNLIVSKIPIITTYGSNKNDEADIKTPDRFIYGTSGLHAFKDNLTLHTTKLIEQQNNDFQLCHNKFCCNFTINIQNIPGNPDYYYRATVYDGERKFGEISANIQVCGVVACKDKDITSCGDRNDQTQGNIVFDTISIKGNFNTKNTTVQFPSIIKERFIPSPFSNYTYCANSKDCMDESYLQTKNEVKDLLGFGIFAVLHNSANSQFSMAVPLVLIFTLLLQYMWNKF